MADNKEAKKELDHLVSLAREKEEKQKNPNGINSYSDVDEIIPPPQPTRDMFYGLVGEVARIASTGTEINPVSAATVFMSFLGANMGREKYTAVNDENHNALLFTVHIGRSSVGGKGMSQGLTWKIINRINEIDKGVMCPSYSGGCFSSGEGLATLIPDETPEQKGTKDKRAWVVESELASILTRMLRTGNTLSSTIRDMFDGKGISPANKKKSITTKHTHIGLHACVTGSELKRLLKSTDVDNGFWNRFFMIHAENVGFVPSPSKTPTEIIDKLARATLDIIKYSLGDYPNNQNTHELFFSDEAKKYSDTVKEYYHLPCENEFIASLLARRKPYLNRLSMLFALTDKSRVIDLRHVKAAAAWIEYSSQSIRFVFSSERQSEKALEAKNNAAKILDLLNEDGKSHSSTEINTKCFKGNAKANKIKEALSYLLQQNPPQIEQIKPNNNKKGRPTTLYKAKNFTKKLIKSTGHATQGLESFLELRNNTKEYEINTPPNHEHLFNSYSFVEKNQEKTSTAPAPPIFSFNSFNSFNSYYIPSGENQSSPENSTIISEKNNINSQPTDKEVV